jgi:hypothetical protein
MSEHTKLPWKHSRKSIYISDMNHTCLAQLLRNDGENEANAALIVRAVNSYAQLVEALQPFATVTVTPSGEIVGLAREHINAARAALASLKESA